MKGVRPEYVKKQAAAYRCVTREHITVYLTTSVVVKSIKPLLTVIFPYFLPFYPFVPLCHQRAAALALAALQNQFFIKLGRRKYSRWL